MALPDAKVQYNIFCNKFRYFILVLGTLCLTSIFSNMVTLNFTIICMDSLHSEDDSDKVKILI